MTLTMSLKSEAHRQGFQLVGVCPAVTPTGLHHFYEWLDVGYAGEMRYLESRRAAYEHPCAVLDGVRSLVLLAMNYRTAPPVEPALGEGRVSRYAWGPEDYHDLIHERLRNLGHWFQAARPGSRTRGVVDTAPLLERDFARLAGLGWIGKNTLLLNKWMGSWFFLAALLTDEELDYDAPHESAHCGTCTACLDACPTQAFPQPYLLDATRCISYLTIELRGPIPEPLRAGVGSWLFGCDVCQDVCPWNGRAPDATEMAFRPFEDMNPVRLAELFELDDETFRARYRHTAWWRVKRRGILRNAAIVLGNQADRSAYTALLQGLHDKEPLVRGAAAWALGQLAQREESLGTLIQEQLTVHLTNESDTDVRAEIAASLGRLSKVARASGP
jgi:epoxyqueuosine reductase